MECINNLPVDETDAASWIAGIDSIGNAMAGQCLRHLVEEKA
jgi:hypothetical protein